MVGVHNRNFITDPKAVKLLLDNLPKLGYRYKFQSIVATACENSIRNDLSLPLPQRATTFLIDEKMSKCNRKTFYYSHDFISNGEGNHFGKTKNDEFCDVDSPFYNAECKACQHDFIPLGTLHFGAAHSFAEQVSKMRRGVLARRFNMDKISDPSRCPHRFGMHYCQYIAELKKYGVEHMKRKYNEERKSWCMRKEDRIDFDGLSKLLATLRADHVSLSTLPTPILSRIRLPLARLRQNKDNINGHRLG